MPWLLVKANFGYFRQHLWLLVLALLGILLGVAVVAGVEITSHSARTNYQLASQQLLGQGSHRISSDRPIPESLLTSLRTELGVTAAPLIRRHLRLQDSSGPVMQLLGIDPFQLNRFRPAVRLQAGDDFRPRQLLLTEGGALIGEMSFQQLQLASGPLPVMTAAGPGQIRILGRIGEADDSRFSRLLLMDIGRAQQLLKQEGLLDEIELRLTGPQVARVREWLPPGYQLRSRDQRLQATARLGEALHLNLSALGLLALVVGLFLVYNTLLFSLVQRQRLFAQLRSLGITLRELATYLLLELLLLGLIGSVAGLLVGVLLAEQLLVLVTRTINDLYATSPIQQLQLQPALLIRVLLVGVGGALLAGLLPGLRIARLSVQSSRSRWQLERQSRRRSRRFLLLATGLILLALLFWQLPDTGVVGGYVAVTALLLACASLMPTLVIVCCRGLRGWLSRSRRQRLSAGSHLQLLKMAAGDTERGLSRTAVALMALMVAVSATVGMGTMVGSFRSTLEVWLEQRLNADIYLSPHTSVPGDSRVLDAGLWQWLEQQPELMATASYLRVETEVHGARVSLFGNRMPAQTRAGYRFRSGDADEIWADFDRPDQLLISEPLASRYRLKQGQQLQVLTPQGRRSFRVAGVYADFGDDNGRMILGRQNFDRYWQPRPGRVAGLYLKPDQDSGVFIHRLQQRFPEQRLRISESRGVLARSLAIFERTFVVTDVLRLLAVVVAFVGVLAALMALQLERQRELRLYRALGFSCWQRIRLLMYQSLLIGGLAGLAAVPAGLLLAWGLIDLIQLRAFGWTLVYELQPLLLLQAPLLAISAALLATLWPAWQLLAAQRRADQDWHRRVDR